MMRQFELVDRVVSYEPDADEDLLNRAYVFGTKMHGDQKRASGDPYFSHPIEVAGILTELHLDTPTIATGLLHDTLEDTEATFAEIDQLFGKEVAELVNGVTKLSKLEMGSSSAAQAENFRKLLLATANDVRVLLVKLADRLHNMRTLHFISAPEKRQRIAQETMDIYAPLAGRMGMQNFREEYEDLAFKELNPEARNLVLNRLDELDATKGAMLEDIAYEFRNTLTQDGVSARVSGRRKRPFSIWRKMQNKSISLEQLSDIYGYRVIVNSEDDCYRALGVLHRNYRVVPGRFKDYISMPKLNNYRSIHTTVIGPNKQRVEIQIRTEEMHMIAESGVAAHWSYKEMGGKKGPLNQRELKPFNWLHDMIDQLKAGGSAEEFMENTRLELFTDQVFCFTPKGRLIALPLGATVLDFAYAVHTEVGNSCSGARINGRQMPLRTNLKNGDEIEIIRADKIVARPIWLQNVVTGKARAAIRQILRDREEADFALLGENLVKTLFASKDVEFKREIIERAVGLLKYSNLSHLYADVGRGRLAAADLLSMVLPQSASTGLAQSVFDTARRAFTRSKKRKATHAVPVSHVTPGTAMAIADGCFPLPGDNIVGILTKDKGLVIYPAEAPELEEFENDTDRWVEMRWLVEAGSNVRFDARLQVTIVNKTGTLGLIAQTIADFDANITNLTLWQRDDDFYDLLLDIQVQNVEHVKKIMSALRGSSVVSRVERIVVQKKESNGSKSGS